MASDGPGKYRERKNRATKPYDRPKGIIRRVTDSVTGLFSASWLSGWMGGDEEEEGGGGSGGGGGQQSTSTSHSVNLPPPGESFIFTQPATTRRPFKPFYPEEGETDSSGQQSLGINEGASTSCMSAPAAAAVSAAPLGLSAAPPRPMQLGGGDLTSPVVTGRRLPVLSSTPTSMFASRAKGHLEPRSLPLIATSTPTGDDGSSEVSESSVDTGVDASVVPRPDERDYQREILQLDEESLQTLRDSLSKTVPTPATPSTQPPAAAILPTLEETRKRPRDLEPDQSSIRAEGSVSSKSLFSEVGSMSHSQPQPSGLASKRPRFNISMYGSPLLDDKSVLSDSAFKASPFYPGKTMYGGASAYTRSRRLQSRTQLQTSRAQVKAKAPSECSSSDGGLSQAARRILEGLEQMSTPISDAKRIPTPTPGQRGSFLDHLPGSYRAAAFHRHRTSLRLSAPPTASLLTPTKVPVQSNLATSLLTTGRVGNSSSGSSQSQKNAISVGSGKPENTTPTSNTTTQPSTVIESKKDSSRKEDGSDNPVISIFTKAAAEATAKFTTPSQQRHQPASSSSTPLLPSQTPNEVFKFGLTSDSSASQPAFQFVPKPVTTTAVSDAELSSKKFCGKLKSKVVESVRGSTRLDEETVEDPKLPSVSLAMPSLPMINLSIASPAPGTPSDVTSSPKGFKFSTPEVVDAQEVSETLQTPLTFTFRSPVLVGEARREESNNDNPSTPVVTTQIMFNSSTVSFTPKLKINTGKSPTLDTLKEGSILDILKPKGDSSPDKFHTSLPNNHEDALKMPSSKPFPPSQPINNIIKEADTSQNFQGFGSAFKRSSNEWDCSVCMVRNKDTSSKCVACQNPREGKSVSSSAASAVSGTGGSNSSTVGGNSGTVGSNSSALWSEPGWGDAFKKLSSEWECETCMLRNKDSNDKCVACETPRPDSKRESRVEGGSVSEGKSDKAVMGFGTVFAKAKGEWECDTCLVRNKSDATSCISCETPKPGTANVCHAITGNFKFGVNTSSSSTSSSTGGVFKFGLSNSQTGVQPPTKSGGFSFGVSAKIPEEEEEEEKGDLEFKFGVPTEKSNALTGFAFGVRSVNDMAAKEKTESSSSGGGCGFTFGVQPVEDKSKENSGVKLSSALPMNRISESSGIGSLDSTSAFQFTANKTNINVGFGKTPVSESPSKLVPFEVNPVELKPGSVVDPLKGKGSEAKAEACFGAKVDSADSKTTMFGLNNIVAPANKDSDKKLSPPFTFTVSTPADSTSEVTSTFRVKPETGTNTTSSSSFTFGDKAATGTTFPPFTFAAPAVSKDETKSNFTFNTSSKRDTSDASEPAKKMAFGSPGTGINNGVSATSPSLFTFGSKENKLGTGTGFGAPPATSPAFGAPAPSSNTTPSFQFGNSNPPAPAATAPSPAFGNPALTFGGAASVFGNTNSATNSSSSGGFIFGQSSEKKSSAGFDFGQAATNTTPTARGFNFGGASQPAAGLFQFGSQNQVNSSSSGGIFQFGSTGTEVPPPATAFGGGDNPFNASTPSGRVVKKAIRRSRK